MRPLRAQRIYRSLNFMGVARERQLASREPSGCRNDTSTMLCRVAATSRARMSWILYEAPMTSSVGTANFPQDTADVARQFLLAEHCALIVVDIQEKLLPPIFNNTELVMNSQLLVRVANILEIPTIVTTQYVKGLGPTVPEIASLLANTQPIDKMQFGCFGCNEFRAELKALPGKRNTLLVCGMEAHICVMQTVLGALNDGYLAHIASDAVGSRVRWNWEIGLDRMRAAGAVISTTEMMIYELLSASGTPQFKQMLPYLKG
jgi:nicotinamidase-related amidase